MGLRQRGNDFYERISANFDKKKVCTMGKMIKRFTFINCPVVIKRGCRFTIDNNFFPLLIAPHGMVSQTSDDTVEVKQLMESN